MLKMDLEYRKGILFVRLKGNLNQKNRYKIDFYLNPVLKKHQIKYLVYNLANLNDIDASGIDALINSKWQMKKNRGKIYCCRASNLIKDKINYLKIPKIKNERIAYKLVEV